MATTSTSRTADIIKREQAIKRKLDSNNKKVISKAKVGKNYSTQYVKGAREGFSKSDYGASAGAAIPYQVGTKTQKRKTKKPIRLPESIETGTAAIPKYDTIVAKGKLPTKRVDFRTAAIRRRLNNG